MELPVLWLVLIGLAAAVLTFLVFSWLCRFSFVILVLCAVFHLFYLGLGYIVAKTTDPPRCQVGFDWPLPFATCPGLNFGAQIDLALSIPGAILAFPFIAKQLYQSGSAPVLYITIPVLIHLFAWLFVFFRITGYWRK